MAVEVNKIQQLKVFFANEEPEIILPLRFDSLKL